MALTANSLKKGEFIWSNAATKAFVEINQWIVKALVMHLLDFFKVFKVACDAWSIWISGVLSHESQHVITFNKGLNDTRKRYLTYDKEFYMVVQLPRH